MVAYPKPAGYRRGVNAGALTYKRYNNFLSGDMAYGCGDPTPIVVTFTFTAAPANGSGITVPEGPFNQPATPTSAFIFTYSGSPGPGVIPLVAGGGTAAQAATAAQVALSAQLTKWIVTNPSAGVLVFTAKQKGLNIGPGLTGSTNITTSSVGPKFNRVLPGRAGKIAATLPDE